MMHRQGAKSIPISGLDDKQEITVLQAVALADEYLPPQIVIKGKTKRCYLAIEFPSEWDIWHSENHWTKEIRDCPGDSGTVGTYGCSIA